MLNIEQRRQLLQSDKFSIISNNCWGGWVYQYFGLKYTSPFVGLFLFSKDYLKLLKNLRVYMDTELTFINPLNTQYKNELMNWGTYNRYPIGLLDKEIEIHFLHFRDNEEANEKWNKRKLRIDYDRLIIKYCDRDLSTVEDIKEFNLLRYDKKIALTAKEYPYECCIKLKNEERDFIENEWENFLRTVNIINLLNKKKWRTFKGCLL